MLITILAAIVISSVVVLPAIAELHRHVDDRRRGPSLLGLPERAALRRGSSLIEAALSASLPTLGLEPSASTSRGGR